MQADSSIASSVNAVVMWNGARPVALNFVNDFPQVTEFIRAFDNGAYSELRA
jgi:hypothetical protein